MSETKQVAVPITIPVLLPGEELVSQFDGKLPKALQFLIDNNYMTQEETVSYLQFRVNLTEIANNHDEFLAVFREIKEQMARKESGIILPNGY